MAKGKIVVGTVVRCFRSRFDDGTEGEAYVIHLVKPMTAADGGGLVPQVSVGGMRGLQMALQASTLNVLRQGDKVHIEATGVEQPTQEGYSPMVLFAVEVTREGKIYRGRTEDAKAPFLKASFWGV